MLRCLLLLLLLPVLVACSEPVELTHAGYLWQRSWTPAVVSAVAAAPVEELRVLALEVEAAGVVAPDVDAGVLAAAGRPVVAVIRIGGARLPAELTLERLHEITASWRAAGVPVTGVEVDHDCAADALGDYADWLARERVRAPGERWSITALPSWTGSPALPRLTGLVDEVVLQVHAVRAPAIFEPARARAWLEEFAAARAPGALRVALPTYRVEAGAADPAEVQAFVAELEADPVPGLEGVVWFRLPVRGDRSSWSGETLVAVMEGQPLRAELQLRLVSRGEGRADIVVENTGNIDAPWPKLVLTRAEAHDVRRRGAPVRPGERVVAGWARGGEVRLAR